MNPTLLTIKSCYFVYTKDKLNENPVEKMYGSEKSKPGERGILFGKFFSTHKIRFKFQSFSTGIGQTNLASIEQSDVKIHFIEVSKSVLQVAHIFFVFPGKLALKDTWTTHHSSPNFILLFVSY